MIPYSKLLRTLLQLHHGSKARFGLHHPLVLSKALNFPQQAYPTIHVAGTNGKGSVSTKIAKALQGSGLKVGLYTSPHLFSFRERIVVGNEYISEEEMVEGMQDILDKQNTLGIKATFFELTTILAFAFFRKKKVDVAVIEAGLGGRFDATNIITPLLSVITSIGFDHEELLGRDLEQIAIEKAGIIKKGVPVVIGPYADFKAIRKKAKECSSILVKVPKIQGFYDKENSEIAKTALEFLNWHFPLSLEAIEEGLRCRPMCRFEEIDGVIFDVAHNPQGLKRLLEAIDEHYPDREVRFVVGMSQDKNTKECLNLLASRAQYVYLTEAKNSRAAKTERLAQELNEIGFSAFSVEKNPLHAVQRAQLEAEQFNALLVICGSFYIMPEAKSALGELVAQD